MEIFVWVWFRIRLLDIVKTFGIRRYKKTLFILSSIFLLYANVRKNNQQLFKSTNLLANAIPLEWSYGGRTRS